MDFGGVLVKSENLGGLGKVKDFETGVMTAPWLGQL